MVKNIVIMKEKEDLDKHIDGYHPSQLYSFDMEIWFDWYVKRLKELLKGDNCLELGIGHGYTTNTFSKFFKSYKVIEGGPKIIERYFENNPDSKVDVMLGYFEEFETSEKFDSILMGYVLEHVDDPELILNKYKKNLTPTGSIFVVVPNGSALNRRFGLKAGYIKSLDEMSEFDFHCGHKRTFTYESLLQLVTDCKLKIERCEGIFIKSMTTEQMINAKIPKNIIQAMCEVAKDFPELSSCILLELKN